MRHPSTVHDAENAKAQTKHCVARINRACDQLFALYTGLAHRMILHPLEFVQRTQLMKRNLLFFRDLHHNMYQRGVAPEVPSLEAFFRYQRRQFERFTWAKQFYCVGSSGGAYAAIASGHVLEADVVWAFSPPTVVPKKFRSEHHPVASKYLDLAELLRDGNGVTEYRIYYSAGNEHDRKAAKNLEKLPGVKLFPQRGGGHGVIGRLKFNGGLETILPPFTGQA